MINKCFLDQSNHMESAAIEGDMADKGDGYGVTSNKLPDGRR